VGAVLTEEVEDLDTAALGDRIASLSGAIDRLRGERARCVAAFERRRGHRDEGASSIVSWSIIRCRMSPSVAAEMVTSARHLEELPATASALREGEIGYQHASLIARTAEQVGDERVREAEPALVDAARILDVRRFSELTRRLRECVDPDGSLRDANRMHEQRRLYLSQTLDGMFRVDGWLDPEGGAVVLTVLNAAGPPLRGDQRSAAQRRADALVDSCRRELDAGRLPLVRGQRPHLWVTVPAETLRGEPCSPGGELRWAGPVVGDLARRLACDAVRTEVTIDANGAPLAVGRPARTVRAGQRRRLVARDKGCRFPGCDRPPEWTDAHHMVPFAIHRTTEVGNLVLLCRLHHRLAHEGRWQIAWGPNGGLTARPP
jgi:hypothetical protein